MAETLEYTITVHDPKRDTDDEVAERVAFSNAIQAEILPDEVPTPVEVAIAGLRSLPERVRRWSFRARDASGALVGLASTGIDPDHDETPDLLQASITVASAARRNGIGTRLLAKVIEVAEAEGRTRIVGSTEDLVPAGAQFAEAIGGVVKSRAHVNRLLVADVDRAQLERWVAEGPGRAPGYELIGWDGPVPDEHLDAWVDLVHVMNTAPRDDLDVNDFVLTAEHVREGEKQQEAVGQVMWVLVARRVSDGAFAGFHDVGWNPSDPDVVWVGATGVKPEHRGHALGKWLKAAMTLRILDERPNGREIRTGNADSNDAMLGINHEMGYRPWIGEAVWEVRVDQVRDWLAGRGI